MTPKQAHRLQDLFFEARSTSRSVALDGGHEHLAADDAAVKAFMDAVEEMASGHPEAPAEPKFQALDGRWIDISGDGIVRLTYRDYVGPPTVLVFREDVAKSMARAILRFADGRLARSWMP